MAFLPQFVDASAGRVGLQMSLLGLPSARWPSAPTASGRCGLQGPGLVRAQAAAPGPAGVTGGAMMVGLGATMLTQD